MISVSDQFGIEMSTAAREAFKKAGFTLAYDKSYPLGTQDLQPLLTEAMRSNADVFVACELSARHPDDQRPGPRAELQSRRCSSPRSAPRSRCSSRRFKDNTEGVMGTGGMNSDRRSSRTT